MSVPTKYIDVYKNIINHCESYASRGLDYLTYMMYNNIRHNSLSHVAITGRVGVGKSSISYFFANKLLKYLAERLVLDESIIYQFIIDHTFFDPIELYRYVKSVAKKYNNIERGIIPFIIIDDAGVWTAPLMFHVDRLRYLTMFSFFNLARSHINNMLYTLPSEALLNKNLRRINMYIMKISFYNDSSIWTRICNLYMASYHLNKLYFRKVAEYVINDIRMPDELYKMYMEKRNQYVELYEKFIEAMEEERMKRVKHLRSEEDVDEVVGG